MCLRARGGWSLARETQSRQSSQGTSVLALPHSTLLRDTGQIVVHRTILFFSFPSPPRPPPTVGSVAGSLVGILESSSLPIPTCRVKSRALRWITGLARPLCALWGGVVLKGRKPGIVRMPFLLPASPTPLPLSSGLYTFLSIGLVQNASLASKQEVLVPGPAVRWMMSTDTR